MPELLLEHSEFSDFEQEAISHLSKASGSGQHACRSALRHWIRAYTLKDQMPELSLFCAITAEEESASGVILALKHKQYQNAKYLNHKNHTHKAAIYPFVYIIGQTLLPSIEYLSPQLLFTSQHQKDDESRLMIRLTFFLNDRPIQMYPSPPLEFSFKKNGREMPVADELREIEITTLSDTIFDHSKKRANERNEYLYASPEGVPTIEGCIEARLERAKSIMFVQIYCYLLIVQHRQNQDFIQKCVDSLHESLRKANVRDDY